MIKDDTHLKVAIEELNWCRAVLKHSQSTIMDDGIIDIYREEFIERIEYLEWLIRDYKNKNKQIYPDGGLVHDLHKQAD